MLFRLAGGLWIAGYALFVATYAPMLLRRDKGASLCNRLFMT